MIFYLNNNLNAHNSINLWYFKKFQMHNEINYADPLLVLIIINH